MTAELRFDIAEGVAPGRILVTTQGAHIALAMPVVYDEHEDSADPWDDDTE